MDPLQPVRPVACPSGPMMAAAFAQHRVRSRRFLLDFLSISAWNCPGSEAKVIRVFEEEPRGVRLEMPPRAPPRARKGVS